MSYPIFTLESTRKTNANLHSGIDMNSPFPSNSSLESLRTTPFYISLANRFAELVSDNGLFRIPVDALDAGALVKAKDMAHNQYVTAMMQNDEELDEHRATLNFLCKAIEKQGHPHARPHSNRPAVQPKRARKRVAKPSVSKAA